MLILFNTLKKYPNQGVSKTRLKFLNICGLPGTDIRKSKKSKGSCLQRLIYDMIAILLSFGIIKQEILSSMYSLIYF